MSETSPDETPPRWGDAPVFSAILNESGLILTWSPAQDNDFISSYEISVLRLEISEQLDVVRGDQNRLLTQFSPNIGDRFQVIAIDRGGLRSEPLEIDWQMNSEEERVIADQLVWSIPASVQFSEVTESSVRATWSEALNGEGIQYTLFNQRGDLLGETSETYFLIGGLEPLRTYEVWVDARDALGRHAAQPLRGMFSTIDETAPIWEENAHLTIVRQANGLRLHWPQATDRGGIDHYVLSMGAEVLATLSASTFFWQGNPSVVGPFSLVAVDRSGLSSVPLTNDSTPLPETGLSWPDGAELIITELLERSVTLRWPQAIGQVSHYEIRNQNEQLGEVPVDHDRVFQISGLPSLSSPFISVTPVSHQGRLGPSLSIRPTLPDLSAPIWPDGALLSMSIRGERAVVLEWTAASDLSGISQYMITLDGEEITRRAGTVHWARLEGLSPWTDHHFEIFAEDPHGRRSLTPLSLTIRTDDQQTPFWSQESELDLIALTSTIAELRWPTAQDEVGVVGYRVFMNGDLLHTSIPATEADEYVLEVEELTPWDHYQFSIQAQDESGNVSEVLSSSIQMPDPDAPTWEEDATLTLVQNTSTTVTLSWPDAFDAGGVLRYTFTLDGTPWTSVLSDRTIHVDGRLQTELIGLSPGQSVLIEVRAEDRAGNSSRPLLLSTSTPDGENPSWPQDAVLDLSVGTTSVGLTWPSALDDVGVTGYTVYRGENLVAELSVEGETQQYMVVDLTPETTYTFTVYALDASGKQSVGLSASGETGRAFDPGFKRLSREQVLRSLADLHAYMWQRGCSHPAHGEAGCFAPRSSEYYYQTFTESNWGDWLDFRRSYPPDILVSPDQSPRGGYLRFDQLVFPEHLNAWVSGVKFIANEYENWVGAGTIVRRPCEWEQEQGITQFPDTEAMHRACLLNWINIFAPLAMRRPITEDERQDFMSIYDEVQLEYAGDALNQNQLFARALSVMLFTINLQPEFLYHVEVGDDQGELTAYELASRLSYHFWDTMPDQELSDAAEDGSLLTQAGLETQVERLFNDPKSLRSIEGFYHDFFRVSGLPDVTVQDGPGGWRDYLTGPNDEEGVYPHYNNTNGANSNIAAAMSREMINLGAWFTYQEPGSYQAMFSSNLHFLECSPYPWQQNACTGAGPWSMFTYKINGVCSDLQDCTNMGWVDTETGWDGVSPPITLPEEERAGLVTRMAMLAHDTLAARPIRRGLNIREILLCDPVPPPEDCDVVKPPAVEGRCVDESGAEGQVCKWDPDCDEGSSCVGADSPVTMTVREKVEVLTEQPGTSCAGCHTTFINGFGHALNHFSSVGQYWEEEHMFTNQRNQHGDFWWFVSEPDQWRTIDASGTTLYQNEWVTMDGAHDLRDFLLSTGQLEWCWSREYFRYTLGRLEWEDEADLIEELAQAMRDGRSLAEAYKAIVYTEPFRKLYKPPTVDQSQGGVDP